MASDYTVFIDESFDGFMNLSKMDGYFCYAALMVPTGKLPDLERFWLRRKEVLVNDYENSTGYRIEDEFKSVYLNKLDFDSRKAFAEKLNYFLKRNKCYVAGFYTTAKNYLAYQCLQHYEQSLNTRLTIQCFRCMRIILQI